MSKRETHPGKLIESLAELELALMQPSIYWRGKSTPTSFIEALQFRVVRQILSNHGFRWSIKEASSHGKGARPSRGVFK